MVNGAIPLDGFYWARWVFNGQWTPVEILGGEVWTIGREYAYVVGDFSAFEPLARAGSGQRDAVEDLITVDPHRPQGTPPILGPGEWLEYYCPDCRRRLHTKHGMFFHGASGDPDEHAPLCGGRSHQAPGPLLAKVCGP